MNQVVPLAALPLPRLPDRLAKQVAAQTPRRYSSLNDSDAGFAIEPPPVHPDPDASRYLCEYEYACKRSDLGNVRAWFSGLNAAVGNPQREGDFAMRVSAAMQALGDLPAAVWNQTTLNEACRKFKFWPAASELDELLRPHAERLWATRHALQRIATASEPSPRPEPRTPEQAEIEAVAAAVRECVATLHPPAKPEATPATAPCWLSDGALLAEYERLHAQGINQSTRIKMLRQRIADVAH